jgi:hypothetical protein
MAREGVAQVLTEKIRGGYLTEEEGVKLGQKILRDNAWELFRLEKRKRT